MIVPTQPIPVLLRNSRTFPREHANLICWTRLVSLTDSPIDRPPTDADLARRLADTAVLADGELDKLPLDLLERQEVASATLRNRNRCHHAVAPFTVSGASRLSHLRLRSEFIALLRFRDGLSHSPPSVRPISI